MTVFKTELQTVKSSRLATKFVIHNVITLYVGMISSIVVLSATPVALYPNSVMELVMKHAIKPNATLIMEIAGSVQMRPEIHAIVIN